MEGKSIKQYFELSDNQVNRISNVVTKLAIDYVYADEKGSVSDFDIARKIQKEMSRFTDIHSEAPAFLMVSFEKVCDLFRGTCVVAYNHKKSGISIIEAFDRADEVLKVANKINEIKQNG